MGKITVLGTGGWGIALALAAYHAGHSVYMWSAFKDEADMLKKNRQNERLLPGITIPEAITISDDITVAESSDITIIAVPSVAVSSVCNSLKSVVKRGIIVNVSKGFEPQTNCRLSEAISRILPDDIVVVLSGPSHAEEVSRNIPTALVAASRSLVGAQIVQTMLSTEFLRIYTSDDIIGVELGGALKNVIAVCAGICDGLKLGDNTKAALITRGLSEMTRLGVCMGANERTFAGLTGIGDLVVTCTSRHSRNNRFGNLVGSGVDIKEALKSVGTVEGYFASAIVHELSKQYNVDLPLMNECYYILYENRDVTSVVNSLMSRPMRME
ncbi:MAG: NAD(P)-dependent glycerol-3-phosphate dehydrogenase [Clostridia bacterium]|nr:NAD(P)-dependent glycerol-3-phosphate dehydrogenase [Clostridia bacterium]